MLRRIGNSLSAGGITIETWTCQNSRQAYVFRIYGPTAKEKKIEKVSV